MKYEKKWLILVLSISISLIVPSVDAQDVQRNCYEKCINNGYSYGGICGPSSMNQNQFDYFGQTSDCTGDYTPLCWCIKNPSPVSSNYQPPPPLPGQQQETSTVSYPYYYDVPIGYSAYNICSAKEGYSAVREMRCKAPEEDYWSKELCTKGIYDKRESSDLKIKVSCFCSTTQSFCSGTRWVYTPRDDCYPQYNPPYGENCAAGNKICKDGGCTEGRQESCSGEWCSIGEVCNGIPVEASDQEAHTTEVCCPGTCSQSGITGCSPGEALVSASDDETKTHCCPESKCWDGQEDINDGSECIEDRGKLQNKICVDGVWKITCPEAGIRYTGCRSPPTPSGQYSDTHSGLFCETGSSCYQCIEGTEWKFDETKNRNDCVPKKIDWENNLGVCKEDDKCYCKDSDICKKENFDTGKSIDSQENPQVKAVGAGEGLCVSSGQYTEDHYCESGDWTTRTALLAAQFLKYVEEMTVNDYVLYCDYYTETLYKYPAALNGNDFNNFCVLRDNKNNKIGFATSLNLNYGDAKTFFKSTLNLNQDPHCTETSEEFVKCDYPGDLYWNGIIQSFVYGINTNPTTLDKFVDFISNPFKGIYNAVKSLFQKSEEFKPPEDFNKFYLNVKDSKRIEASYKENEPIIAKYSNFDADICGPLGETVCKKEGNIHYVLSYTPDLWPDLTTKLRVK